MPKGPLSPGQRISTLDRAWTFRDPEVQVKSEGAAFENLAAAEEEARRLGGEASTDAVVVQDSGGKFWVYQVDELTTLGGDNDLDTEVRDKLTLALPRGVSLRGFFASHRHEGELGGVERVLAGNEDAREHGAQIRDIATALKQAGVPSGQIGLLRRGVSARHLDELRSRLTNARNPHAAALVPYLEAAAKKLKASGRDRMPFDELAAEAPSGQSTRRLPDSSELARLLSDFPDRRRNLSETLATAARELAATETDQKARGRPVARLHELSKKVETARQALDQGSLDVAASCALALGRSFSAGLSRELPGAGRDAMTRLEALFVESLAPPRPTTEVPTELVETTEKLVRAYNRHTELLLNGVFADGYADFIDTLGQTGRLYPHDAASALLRLNTCLWTVLRDARHGLLEPEHLGRREWRQVTAEDLYDLAVERLNADAVDFASLQPAMLADPIWQTQPVHVSDPRKGAFELAPDNVARIQRSVFSFFAPSEAAERVELSGFGRVARDGALASVRAKSPETERAAQAAAMVATAHAMFTGKDMPKNASQALLTMSNVAGVSIANLELAELGATEADLEGRAARGEILGFKAVGPTFLVYRPKSVADIATEIRKKLDGHELDALGPEALRQLDEMTGTELPSLSARVCFVSKQEGSPGSRLRYRLETEAESRFWRELSSEVIKVAAIGAASMGVGAVVEGFAAGAKASYNVIRAARFVANSATFTTLSGVTYGELDPTRYPIDMAMFAVLGLGGRFARLAQKLAPGSSPAAQLAQLGLGHGTSVAAATTLLTGFAVLEGTVRGQAPGFQQAKDQFVHNLFLVTALHAVNLGVARIAPQIAPGAPLRRQYEALATRTQEGTQRLLGTLDDLSRVLDEAARTPPNSPRTVALTERAQALMKQLDNQKGEVAALQDDLITFTKRSLPPAQAQAIVAALEEHKEKLEEAKSAASRPNAGLPDLAPPPSVEATRGANEPSPPAKETSPDALGPRQRGERPQVPLQEWTDGTRRFTWTDDFVHTDTGETFRVVGRREGVLLLKDASGKPSVLADTGSGRARFFEPAEGYVVGVRNVALHDGKFLVVDFKTQIVYGEDAKPLGVAGTAETFQLVARFKPGDPLAPKLAWEAGTKGEPLKRWIASDGAVYWRAGRFLVAQDGTVRQRFAASADGTTTLYVDASGQGVALRENTDGSRVVEPLREGKVEGVYLDESAPATDASHEAVMQAIRNVRNEAAPPSPGSGPETSPADIELLRALVPGFGGVLGGVLGSLGAMGMPKSALNPWVVDGRLYHVAEHSGMAIGFDVDGAPQRVFKKTPEGTFTDAASAEVPVTVVGSGKLTGVEYIAYKAEGAAPEFLKVELTSHLSHLVQRADGNWAIAEVRGDGTTTLRQGLFEHEMKSGPSKYSMRFAVVEGEKFELKGQVLGSNDLAWGLGPKGEALLQIRGQGAEAKVEIAPPGTSARVASEQGLLLRVMHGGESYVVVGQPMTRQAMADHILTELGAGLSPTTDVTLRQRSTYERLNDALTAREGDRFKVLPLVTHPKMRENLLRQEIVDGDGPLLRAALGGDATSLIEAAVGYAPSEQMPFIFGMKTTGRGPETPARLEHETKLGFDVADFGIFVPEGSNTRPATVSEVQRHFDQATGRPNPRPWSELPRAEDVRIEGEEARPEDLATLRQLASLGDMLGLQVAVAKAQQTMGARKAAVTRGAEKFEFELGPRPSETPAEHLPSDAQIVGWLKELPLQALREVRQIRFMPASPRGAYASYQFSNGTVTFYARKEGWGGPLHRVSAAHEIAGHGIEMGDPLLYRMLMQAAVLDSQSGATYAARRYGEGNPAEYFATLIERYALGDPALPKERPNFYRLLNAIFNEDGSRTDPTLYRRMLQGVLPMLLAAIMKKQAADEEIAPPAG